MVQSGTLESHNVTKIGGPQGFVEHVPTINFGVEHGRTHSFNLSNIEIILSS